MSSNTVKVKFYDEQERKAMRRVFGDDNGLTGLGRKLVKQVAEHLAGRPVNVVWVPAKAGNALASTLRLTDTAIICIAKPIADMGLEGLRYILHEIAHARLHHNTRVDMADKEAVKAAKLRQASQGPAYKRIVAERERQADALAAQWYAYADEHKTGEGLTGRLLALLAWR